MTSQHRMRRQARRVRRGGMQPMMLLTGNDQLPESAVVLVFRWAWRYRSELAPLYAAGAVYAVACWLHAGHRHWWALMVVIAAMTAAALAAFGGRAGLPAPAERLWAATTTLAVGGWIAAATLIRTTGSASGRLGTWWPPAGEHWTALDFESFRKSVPLPVTRES